MYNFHVYFRIYFEDESRNHGGQVDNDSLKRFKTGPDNLFVEFVLIGAVALICIILFIIYIRLAKNEVCMYELEFCRQIIKNWTTFTCILCIY